MTFRFDIRVGKSDTLPQERSHLQPCEFRHAGAERTFEWVNLAAAWLQRLAMGVRVFCFDYGRDSCRSVGRRLLHGTGLRCAFSLLLRRKAWNCRGGCGSNGFRGCRPPNRLRVHTLTGGSCLDLSILRWRLPGGDLARRAIQNETHRSNVSQRICALPYHGSPKLIMRRSTTVDCLVDHLDRAAE